MVPDDLGEPERRLQPVLDGEAVTHHAGRGLNDPQHSQQRAEAQESIVPAIDDSLLDRLADRVGHQCLRHHPDDPEADRCSERPGLMTPHPEEKPDGRARVRSPRIGDRELDHGRTSGLYAMRCGSSASGPRVSTTQSWYSA